MRQTLLVAITADAAEVVYVSPNVLGSIPIRERVEAQREPDQREPSGTAAVKAFPISCLDATRCKVAGIGGTGIVEISLGIAARAHELRSTVAPNALERARQHAVLKGSTAAVSLIEIVEIIIR